jgi:peroxiredoxin Q/BCP
MKTLAMLVPLALASCQTSSPGGPSPTQTSTAVAAPAASPAVPVAQAAPSAANAAPRLADPNDGLVGKKAPDFTATAQDGTSVHLAALKGKPVVLYFYPADDTFACTKEASAFRDTWPEIAKTGAVLVGVSANTSESHKSFAAHNKLPFLLVSDPDGKIGASYGVPLSAWKHLARQTFVIGPDGNVSKVYRNVDVAAHAAQVVADLGQLPHG